MLKKSLEKKTERRELSITILTDTTTDQARGDIYDDVTVVVHFCQDWYNGPSHFNPTLCRVVDSENNLRVNLKSNFIETSFWTQKNMCLDALSF
jgi:hypothetical protein